MEMSFLLVGHTKFAPDWCFGLVKQKFRKTLVGCLDDMLRVVDQSAKTNDGELVGKEDGTTLIHQYDWAAFFRPYFRTLAFAGITKWHHLEFSAANPGKAVVRETCHSARKTINLLKKDHANWQPLPNDMPDIIPPPGLSQARQKYLYEKIRQFVPDPHKDTVCPFPGVLSGSPLNSPVPTDSEEDNSKQDRGTSATATPKRKRRRTAARTAPATPTSPSATPTSPSATPTSPSTTQHPQPRRSRRQTKKVNYEDYDF